MSTSIQEQDLIQTIKQLEQRISDLERQQRNLGSNVENTAFIDGFGFVSLSIPAGPPPLPTGESGIEITPTGIRLLGRNPAGNANADIDVNWDAWDEKFLMPTNVYIQNINLSLHWLVPATTTSTGTAGDIRWDSGHIYVCTATNTWRRVAVGTW